MEKKYRNKKTQDIYIVTDVVTNATNIDDGQEMYLYHSKNNENVQFVREVNEFEEKFEAINDTIYFYKLKDEYGAFSNFSKFPIVLDDKTWPTSEHYYQAQKFLDPELQEKVRKCESPKLAAEMGRDRNLPLRSDWEDVKDDVMRDAVRAKVKQHSHIRRLLQMSGDRDIAEHTKIDKYWGDGGDGSGKNMLGKIFMEIREEIRNDIAEDKYDL